MACQLLQYAQGRTEQADKVMRALAAAAQAALPVNAATTAAVAEALKTAEAGAAGGLHVNQKAHDCPLYCRPHTVPGLPVTLSLMDLSTMKC